MKTRVLFVMAVPFLGSVWTVCKNVIVELDKERFEVYVAVDRHAEGEIGIRPGDATVTTWDLLPANKDLRSATSLLGSVARLARYARRERIDVVHGNEDAASATIALLVARVARAKLVLHYHTVPSIYSRRRVQHMRVLARAADKNVGVSGFVAGEIARLGITPATVDHVPNGIDVDRFRPGIDGSRIRHDNEIPDDAVLVLQVSRIWKEKRQGDFVRAFALAKKEVENLRGLAIGWEDPRYKGPYASYGDELRHIIEDEGVAGSFRIARARPEAAEIQSAADIAVLPSVDEPFGLVVIEAMACGKPVVGVRSGGIPEIIEDGTTGFLTPPDSPRELAEKLVVLARDAELRARMGRAGRAAVVERFGSKHVAKGFERVYAGLVARG